MFDINFYPTPPAVLHSMVEGENITGKTILEPSAGKGDLVEFLRAHGAAEVLACEKHPDLLKIVRTKCRILATDFLTVTSDQVSHIDAIYMNPPFDEGDKHILHAYDIAPPGCRIIALCNSNTLKNAYTKTRERLTTIISEDGHAEDLGDCFTTSERTTNVHVTLLRITKPGARYKAEFEGFFMEEDPEEAQTNGLMPYNVIRDLVQRYINAVKIFDKQLAAAVEMNDSIGAFYHTAIAMTCTKNGEPLQRANFKKELQKSAWLHIFDKMNMKKYATQGLKEDINKFVEKQTAIPFTMRNVYKMLEIIVGTQGQRMDKALVEVFEKLTKHTHENRYSVEGWKSNSHYLVNRKFIIPNMCYQDQRWYKGESKIQGTWGSNFELMEDLMKALCYFTGDMYESFGPLNHHISYMHKLRHSNTVEFFNTFSGYNGYADRLAELEKQGKYPKLETYQPIYGESFEWSYFRVKAYKKGTVHFEFKDQKVWELFNTNIARIKGYPLYESKKKPEQPKKPTPAPEAPKTNKHTILATFKIKAA